MYKVMFFLMRRRTPRTTRTDTLFPYTTLFRSAAFTKGRGDAGAWSEDAITEIGVAGRESDDEATKNPGIARNIMGVLLVHRMVGEDERQIAAASQTQRRSSEQERVERVDDVGSEAVDQGRTRTGQWQDDGEENGRATGREGGGRKGRVWGATVT